MSFYAVGLFRTDAKANGTILPSGIPWLPSSMTNGATNGEIELRRTLMLGERHYPSHGQRDHHEDAKCPKPV
jgi:hypothetical protein